MNLNIWWQNLSSNPRPPSASCVSWKTFLFVLQHLDLYSHVAFLLSTCLQHNCLQNNPTLRERHYTNKQVYFPMTHFSLTSSNSDRYKRVFIWLRASQHEIHSWYLSPSWLRICFPSITPTASDWPLATYWLMWQSQTDFTTSIKIHWQDLVLLENDTSC